MLCVRTCAGVAQGMITGIRGLCNGLGPALYGFIFFLFNVELNDVQPAGRAQKDEVCTRTHAHARMHTAGGHVWFGACVLEAAHSRAALPLRRVHGDLCALRGRFHP